MKLSVIAGAIVIAGILSYTVYAQTTKSKSTCTGNDACCKKAATNENKPLTCKLTSKELKDRKETVIKSLKSQVIEKKELAAGYQYKFAGTDKMIDELTEFVKTERACCDFFTFNLSFAGENAFLEITGPKGAKEFIKTELEL